MDDAVRAAGGPTAPRRPGGGEPGRQGQRRPAGHRAGGGRGRAGRPRDGSGRPGWRAPRAAPGRPLNLNTATPEQLDQLDGVGPATAQKIVAYRQAHGGFRSVSELDQVPGIGEKKLAALKDRVRV